MVWGDNPGRVNERKGYGAINRLCCFVVIWGTDGVHSGSNYGCLWQFLSLTIGLILVVGWASQYVINCRLGLGWKL